MGKVILLVVCFVGFVFSQNDTLKDFDDTLINGQIYRFITEKTPKEKYIAKGDRVFFRVWIWHTGTDSTVDTIFKCKYKKTIKSDTLHTTILRNTGWCLGEKEDSVKSHR